MLTYPTALVHVLSRPDFGCLSPLPWVPRIPAAWARPAPDRRQRLATESGPVGRSPTSRPSVGAKHASRLQRWRTRRKSACVGAGFKLAPAARNRLAPIRRGRGKACRAPTHKRRAPEPRIDPYHSSRGMGSERRALEQAGLPCVGLNLPRNSIRASDRVVDLSSIAPRVGFRFRRGPARLVPLRNLAYTRWRFADLCRHPGPVGVRRNSRTHHSRERARRRWLTPRSPAVAAKPSLHAARWRAPALLTLPSPPDRILR